VLGKLYGSFWSYYNHQKLYELADLLDWDLRTGEAYNYLREHGYIGERGFLKAPELWKRDVTERERMYDLSPQDAHALSTYHRHTLEAILSRMAVLDVSGCWHRHLLLSLLAPGIMVLCERHFHFKKLNKAATGRQPRRCYTRSADVELTMDIDAWESTSGSARRMHLVKRADSTTICMIRSLQDTGTKLLIQATCLAIGTRMFGGAFLQDDSPSQHFTFGPNYYKEEAIETSDS
jgi:hypothetical protein